MKYAPRKPKNANENLKVNFFFAFYSHQKRTNFECSFHLDELEEDLGRNNDDMSVSDMSATTFDNDSVTGKSVASTVNTQFSNK